jgi:hypothetical protein
VAFSVRLDGIESAPFLGITPAGQGGNPPSPEVSVDSLGSGLRSVVDQAGGLLAGAFAGQDFGGIDAGSLADGLNGSILEQSEAIASPPDGVTQINPGGLLQFAGGSFLSRIFETSLDLNEVREGGALEDPTALLEALAAIEGVTLVSCVDSGDGTPCESGDSHVEFDLELTRTLNGIVDLEVAGDALLDSLELGDVIELTGSVEISADVTVNLSFGIDANGFYIKPKPGVPEVVVKNLRVSGEVSGGGQFGFLGVGIGQLALAVDEDLELRVDLRDSGINAPDGLIRLAELTPSSLADSVDFSVSSPGIEDIVLTATLSTGGVLDAVDFLGLADTEVSLTWADIASESFEVAVSEDSGQDGAAYLDFLKLRPDALLQELGNLRDQLASVTAALGIDVPLLGQTLDQLVNLSESFDMRILSQLGFTFDGASGPVASFGSAQQLAEVLASSLSDSRESEEVLGDLHNVIVSLEELGLAFDKDAGELTYQVNAETFFSMEDSFSFDLGGAGAFGDANLNSTVALDVTAGFEFTLGIDLADLSFDLDSLLDNLFIRDAVIQGAVQFDASDLDAAARFGFLDVEVKDGVGTADFAVSLNLQDPGTRLADGRIDLSELIDVLATDPGLLTSGPAVSGGANFSLPLAAPFLGIDASADTTLLVDIPDLGNPTDVNVTLPGTAAFDDFLDFENLGFADIVALLRQLRDFLVDIEGFSFLNDSLPLLNKSPSELLDFADELLVATIPSPSSKGRTRSTFRF